MMSASTNLLESCKGVCGDDYLEKPFELKELLNKVDYFIQKPNTVKRNEKINNHAGS